MVGTMHNIISNSCQYLYLSHLIIIYCIPTFRGASWIPNIAPNIVGKCGWHYKLIIANMKSLQPQHILYKQRKFAQNISFKQWQTNNFCLRARNPHAPIHSRNIFLQCDPQLWVYTWNIYFKSILEIHFWVNGVLFNPSCIMVGLQVESR